MNSEAARRTIRTIIQALLGLAAVVPSAAAVFNLSAEDTAKVAGAMGVAVAALVAIQNALEDAGVLPKFLKPNPAPDLPRDPGVPPAK